MRHIFNKIFIALFLLSSAAFAQTSLISAVDGGFEAGNAGWTIVNGNGGGQANKWFIGTTSFCSGTQGAFVGTASTNNTYTITTSSVVHLYRDVVFPAGQSSITLSFDFKGQGESCCDYMRVYVLPTTTNPAAGTLPASGQVGNTAYNMIANCTNYSITLNPAFAGTTQRIVFTWRNDASVGTDPAATLDNVRIVTQVPPPPGCATLTSPANGSTTGCNSGFTLNWTAPTTGGAPSGYKLFLGTNNPPNNIVNGTNLGNVLSYTPTGLLPNTVYYWRIVPTNGGGDATGCTVGTFTTGGACILQGSGNFNTCSGAFFDSGGPSGNYSNNANSVTTICPQAAGQYVTVTFNAFNLENNFDNLIIYNGNSTASPSLGTFTGTTLPSCISSTSTNGCLTFAFSSDATVNYAGWDATISCTSTLPGVLPGSTCANAPVSSLPLFASNQTTACYRNDYTNASTGSCGTIYESGEDRVYAISVPSPQCISVTITNSTTPNIGYQVYSGCPGTAGTTCIGNAGGALNGTLSGSFTVSAAGTYYIVVDTWSQPFNAEYSIQVNSLGTGPTNDLPCNAVQLALGTTEPGDNTCSSSAGDPARPACWDAGVMNTVWYRVTPTSSSLRLRTITGSLTATQIAVYSGNCSGGLTLVAGGCNDDIGSCGTVTNFASEVLLSGLTAGTNYFIAVDGDDARVGTFSILALDGAALLPPVEGMDCILPNPVCSSFFQVSDPGYAGFGNFCDLPSFPNAYCLAAAERNVVWYRIPINAAGNLVFDLVPNDFSVTALDETDYDFAVWRVAGAGAVTCSQIASGGATPLECNYSALGITGLNGTADLTAPASLSSLVCPSCGPYSPNPTYNGAYQSQIPVSAGDVLLLAVSNFSNSTSGFRIDFKNSPIGYVGNTATSVTWTGGTNSVSTLNSNWGGCSSPTCGIDGVVAPFINQPVIATNQSFKDLEIQAGATVTINAGVTVTICGNLINNGNLRCSPTSTILFTNPIAHSMIGSFTGLNALGNLTINASGAGMQVNLMNDLDLKGTFTSFNTHSIFNANSNNIKVAGNFINNNGNTTFPNVGTGFLEFNGSATQNYNQGTSQLDLNIVNMNHTGPGVNLQTNMCMKAGTGQLNLTLGRIITNAFEVRQYNRSATSVTTGNASSFVQGFLRRWINSTGSYDFPLGDAAKGYERSNFNFTAGGNIDNLLGKFFPFSGLPAPSNLLDCNGANLYNFPYLDHGYWQVNAYDATLTKIPGTGSSYRTTLYNLGYTNSAGAICWTVMKDASLTGSWVFDGVCNAASTAAITIRDGMSGFSNFAAGQGGNPLPIELIRFDGFNDGERNVLQWSTATETNNDYFTLKRSADGIQFEPIAQMQGAGNSTTIRNYEYVDNSPLAGINYYMLMQTDFDGAS
ncbi:MAG: putative adhesin, partial [Bacteroidota bacterium]